MLVAVVVPLLLITDRMTGGIPGLGLPSDHTGPVLGGGTAHYIINPTLPHSEGSGSFICLQIWCNIPNPPEEGYAYNALSGTSENNKHRKGQATRIVRRSNSAIQFSSA